VVAQALSPAFRNGEGIFSSLLDRPRPTVAALDQSNGWAGIWNVKKS
jgi:hypothetical protein